MSSEVVGLASSNACLSQGQKEVVLSVLPTGAAETLLGALLKHILGFIESQNHSGGRVRVAGPSRGPSRGV